MIVPNSPGYYWIRYQGDWWVAEWTGDRWLIFGASEACDSGEIEQVGPQINPPSDL